MFLFSDINQIPTPDWKTEQDKNPTEMIDAFKDAKKYLEDARKDIKENSDD